MRRNIFAVVLAVIVIALALSTASFAVETTKAPAVPAQKVPPRMPTQTKPNFGMIAGTVMSIDNADPANVKITVKNDADGSMRTVSATQWTNITKVTDISELKIGEPVRMMTRKVDDKDVAMGIMFGKVRTMPAPMPKTSPAPQAAQVQKAPRHRRHRPQRLKARLYGERKR